MPSGKDRLDCSVQKLFCNKVWIHVDCDALSFDKKLFACVGITVKDFVLGPYFIIAEFALQDLTKRFVSRVSRDDGMINQIPHFFDFGMTFEILCRCNKKRNVVTHRNGNKAAFLGFIAKPSNIGFSFQKRLLSDVGAKSSCRPGCLIGKFCSASKKTERSMLTGRLILKDRRLRSKFPFRRASAFSLRMPH
jgi:hypothetical protein